HQLRLIPAIADVRVGVSGGVRTALACAGAATAAEAPLSRTDSSPRMRRRRQSCRTPRLAGHRRLKLLANSWSYSFGGRIAPNSRSSTPRSTVTMPIPLAYALSIFSGKSPLPVSHWSCQTPPDGLSREEALKNDDSHRQRPFR